MAEKLNKLQIRAKIIDIINSYQKETDFDSNLHTENIKFLNLLSDKKFVCEILLKELVENSGFKQEVIKYLIADYATLENVEETIWQMLQNPNIEDKKKQMYLQILRLLGGKVDMNVLMDCIKDIDNLVDEQTQELLEEATVNPEAQIDFLDFLTSLNSKEQIDLITSLNDDFQGDELANMLYPALLINVKPEVKEKIISILADSNSFFAIEPLKTFIASTSDKSLQQTALKALNKIKSNGLDIDSEEKIRNKAREICANSKFYKAYISQVDGCGNQGLIFSRISENNQIIMFSTVVNVNAGVMDCFGLMDISVNDFRKVVTRFKANDFVVPIEASTIKYILTRAEQLNKETNTPLPYEYSCWKVYASDITEKEIDYNNLIRNKINDFSKDVYEKLYDTEVFDSWFFEYDDNIHIKEFIDCIISNKDKPAEKIYELIENRTDEIFPQIYTENIINEYSSMLNDTAYIFYLNFDYEKSNIAANLANQLSLQGEKFLKDIIRRSVLQYLATIVAHDDEEAETNIFAAKSQQNISEQEAFDLLNNLEQQWDNQ